MIWSDKTKEAVAKAVAHIMGCSQETDETFWRCRGYEAQAALAAVAESDEWKAKDQEIERLKQPTIGSENTQTVYNLLAENERLKRQIFDLHNPWCLTSPRYKNLMSRYMPGVFHAIEALAAADKMGAE